MRDKFNFLGGCNTIIITPILIVTLLSTSVSKYTACYWYFVKVGDLSIVLLILLILIGNPNTSAAEYD